MIECVLLHCPAPSPCRAQIFTLMGINEFMPSSEILSKLEGQLCQYQPYLCVNLLSAICGYNPDNLDVERLPIYLNFTPSGTSVQNMAKWAQVRGKGYPCCREVESCAPIGTMTACQ